jgi:hypothetical protein
VPTIFFPEKQLLKAQLPKLKASFDIHGERRNSTSNESSSKSRRHITIAI